MVAVLKPRADAKTKVVHISCPHDCPDACSLLVTVERASNKAIKVEGDPSHPYTKGYLCGKVNHYLDYVYNDQRVLYPHRRLGPKGPGATFERITWEHALATITQRFKTIIAEYGAEAIQPYSYSGTLGVLGFAGMSERFWHKMGAARLLRTICTAAGSAARLATTGNADEANPEDVVNAKVVILWATNLVSTGVHMMPFLNQARENGATIIAIDPRVTRTTQFADWHIQPKPGTDAALALGMMKIIVDRGMHDEAFLRKNTVGWEQLLKQKLPGYPLEKVAAITGIPTGDIERLALLYGSSKKTFIRLNWGIQRHDNGGMTIRAIRILPAITGAWGYEGMGCCISTGPEMRGIDFNKLQRPDLLAGRNPRTINMIQIGAALNDPTLSPPIKALFIWNSDPANCVPDTQSARKGMAREDLFTVVHDPFFTDSCLFADIVLPADTQLEHMDLHAPYGQFNFGLSQPAIPLVGESLDNQELFRRMAKAMGYTEPCFEQSDEDMIREIIDPERNSLFEGVTFERLQRDGWAPANLKSPRRMGINSGKWPTPSGKIEIYSETLATQGMDPLPAYVPESEGLGNAQSMKKYPLQVISAATHYFIGSSFQQVPRMNEMTARPTFELSIEDAQQRGIANDDFCRLYNDRGETFGFARVVPGLKPGVLGAPKQIKGSNTPGGLNVNALISSRVADMGGSPVFYSTLAEIEKVEARA